MEKSKEAKIIRVEGKVQGVFFRNSTQKMAVNLGITGSVKNEYDGSVLIEAEADSDSMKQFIEWCKVGPEFARVDAIQVSDKKISGFDSFEVIR